MNKNKLEEILKKTVPPEEIDNSKKQNLRRELLNSKHFEKKNYGQIFFSPKNILAGVFAALITIVILLNFNNAPVELSELKQLSTSYYSNLVQQAGFTSFNNKLTLFGTNSNKVKLNVEQTVKPGTGNIYIKIYDENRIEKLDEIIIKDGELYRSEYPKIKTIGTISRLSSSKFQVFVIDDSAEIPAKLKKLTDAKGGINFTSKAPENGFLVYSKPVKTMDEIPSYNSKSFYQEVPKEIDIDKYFGTTPLKLADEINSSSNVKYIGDKYDEESSETFHLIEITSDISENTIKEYQVILNRVDSLTEYSLTIDKIDSIKKIHFDGKSDIAWMEGDSLKSYKELKTIALEPNSGKINKVEFAIIKDDRKINLSEIRFLGTSSIKSDTSFFNPKKKGLIYVGPSK